MNSPHTPFKVAKSLIQKLIKRSKEEGTIEPMPHRSGPMAKLTGQEEIIKELIQEKPDYKLPELGERFNSKTGISVSVSPMCIRLQRLNLNRKKKLYRTTQAETEKNLRKRVEYWENIREINPHNLVFLDETGMNLASAVANLRRHERRDAMTCLYARSPKGERVYDNRPYRRGTNITTIGAISLSGFQGIMTINVGCDKNVFQVFIQQVLLPNLWEGACLVMDNLSVHKIKEIRDIIEQAGVQEVRSQKSEVRSRKGKIYKY